MTHNVKNAQVFTARAHGCSAMALNYKPKSKAKDYTLTSPLYSPSSPGNGPVSLHNTPSSRAYSPITPLIEQHELPSPVFKDPMAEAVLPTKPEGSKNCKLYSMDCCQCSGTGYSIFPYPACANCGHDQCEVCTGNS